MKKTALIWIVAVLVTLFSVVFQRLTGPSYPVRGRIDIAGEPVRFEFFRSHESTADAPVVIAIANEDIRGEILWRRLKSHDTLQSLPLVRRGGSLEGFIPRQPAAGKIAYRVILYDGTATRYDLTGEPVVIRFTDPVPRSILVLHILFIFTAMLMSNKVGLDALVRKEAAYRQIVATVALVFVGGLIFGPVVQKYAFGALWTGWPLGHDLTDNKTLVAFLFWLPTLWKARRAGTGRGWVILAAVVTLVIFLIPHSVLGSELDYREMGGD